MRKEEDQMSSEWERQPGPSWAALILIFVGLIFLMNNFGVLPWSIWETLWRFWPVLLIIAGIQSLLGRNYLGRILTLLLVLAVLALILAITLSPTNPEIKSWLQINLPFLNLDQINNPLTGY